MGERALAVLEDRQRWYCYRSQWAGADDRLGRVLRDGPPAVAGARWQRCPGPGAGESPDHLEYAALYLVTRTGTTVHQPVWLGFDATAPPVESTEGVFVRIESVTERRHLRRYVAELKERFREAIDADRLASTTARELLRGALVAHAPRGRLWRWPPGPSEHG